MPSVSDSPKSVQTKHKNIVAILNSDWESYDGGRAEISFILLNEEEEEIIRIEKTYSPRSYMYISGEFTSEDVIRDYGKQFDKWVREVNKRKYIKRN